MVWLFLAFFGDEFGFFSPEKPGNPVGDAFLGVPICWRVDLVRFTNIFFTILRRLRQKCKSREVGGDYAVFPYIPILIYFL